MYEYSIILPVFMAKFEGFLQNILKLYNILQ